MMANKKKLFIITTIPMSFVFFKGQLLVLREKFDITLISSPEAGLYETASFNKVKCYGIKMSREISLFSDVLSLFRLLFYFVKNKPDILHANTPKGSFLSLAAGWLCRVSTRIYYVHGLRYQGESGFKKKLLIAMEKLSCFFATDIIAVSNGVKDHLQQDFITTKEITVIWNGSINGIDLDYFDPAHPDLSNIESAHLIQKYDFVFGFLGRLVGDKGINELVAAFEQLNLEYLNIKLLLVGGYESHLDPLQQETLLSIKTNPNIVHVGFQEDVRPYLEAMDLFVFPSYREGFGISLMEAAAMNVPAISSNITGCNEIIDDGINGFLIPVKDKEAIYLKMKYAIENRLAISKMSAVTRSMIKDKFEQHKLWNKIISFYEGIKH
ncbi:glycosyltransferase family 4 protein [Chryseobacterium sp. MDT2-18]|uniref:glycosyltransferase family 4 protein n=1 Tax=Chryseobacterium sp. MDT2-18 TaxID=1259136 RepID=UPI002783C47D|nr:glycosyltransferase family 4 protein [Chryseobacterium sp. MDT2-18]MDQ0478166.1 glycosyltransferase involved in cell wall biosynthesis [Chryseobacterium sp. MDT2-18]